MFRQAFVRLLNATNAYGLDTPTNSVAEVQDAVIVEKAITPSASAQPSKPLTLAVSSATNRKCQEWDFQRYIQKIMTIEIISFRGAITFKKQNQVRSSFRYSNIVNKQPMVTSKNKHPSNPQSNNHHQYPPIIVSSNYTHHHSLSTSRHYSPSQTSKHFKLPTTKDL